MCLCFVLYSIAESRSGCKYSVPCVCVSLVYFICLGKKMLKVQPNRFYMEQFLWLALKRGTIKL